MQLKGVRGVSVTNLILEGMTTLHMDICGLGNIASSRVEVVGNLEVISVWLNAIHGTLAPCTDGEVLE